MKIVRIAVGVPALALTAQMLFAQQPGAPQPPSGPGDMRGTQMAQQRMRMMDSLNARLDTLVSRMNRATGNRKVTAMADVINELVAQRKRMQEQMRQMMQTMQSRPGMMMPMMGESTPGGGQRPPTPGVDSAAADTGHAAHHPPN